MAARLKVVQEPATTTGRVIDFEEVARALTKIGKEVDRFATGVTHGYLPDYRSPNSLEASILYQVVIDTGDHTSLVVRAYELPHNLWVVHVTLHHGHDRLPCIAWVLTDDGDITPSCVTSLPHWMECSTNNCNGTCNDTIDVGRATVKQLPGQIVRWVRANLPSGGFRTTQHKTATLAA